MIQQRNLALKFLTGGSSENERNKKRIAAGEFDKS